MAEDTVFRKTPAQRLLEDIHVIDSFADERAFSENVLVNVGDRASVGINAWFTAPEPRITGMVCPRKTDRNPRLKDAIALSNALL